MENSLKVCQSCGMPLVSDPYQGGTNADKSKSEKFCSFCYQDGKFLDEGITLEGKKTQLIEVAVSKLNMPKEQAIQMANSILPALERWR